MKKKSSISRPVSVKVFASGHWVTLAIALVATVGLTQSLQAQTYKVLHSFSGADGVAARSPPWDNAARPARPVRATAPPAPSPREISLVVSR